MIQSRKSIWTRAGRGIYTQSHAHLTLLDRRVSHTTTLVTWALLSPHPPRLTSLLASLDRRHCPACGHDPPRCYSSARPCRPWMRQARSGTIGPHTSQRRDMIRRSREVYGAGSRDRSGTAEACGDATAAGCCTGKGEGPKEGGTVSGYQRLGGDFRGR